MTKHFPSLPLFTVLALASLFTAPFALAVPHEECGHSSIRTLSRPYFPSHKGKQGPSFPYKYMEVRKAQPGQKTVIYLAGGPGTEFPIREWVAYGNMYPIEMGVVLLDPRGIGCNSPDDGQEFPNEFYSTQNLASDVLAVVKDLDLREAEYILNGSSYGTMVATVAAGLAEKGEAPRPAYLALAGIIGKSDSSPKDNFLSWRREWKKAKATLPEEVKQALKNGKLPDGVSEHDFGSWVVSRLSDRSKPPFPQDPLEKSESKQQAKSPVDRNFIVLYRILAESGSKDAVRLSNMLQGSFPNPDAADKDQIRHYQQIGCREISPSFFHPVQDAGLRLRNGTLFPLKSKICQGIPFLKNYDSKDWPTSVPIYYFPGSLDPSTIPEQAEYHLKTQTRSRRQFASVEGAAHSIFSLINDACMHKLLKDMNAGGKNFEEIANSCLNFPVKVSVHPPTGGPSQPIPSPNLSDRKMEANDALPAN